MDSQVVIVGAGAAGLAAARDLSREGVQVRILEARSRIGGRIHTQHVAGWDLPIELGAEFVHGEPAPTVALAREAVVDLVEIRDSHGLRTPGGLKDRGDVWARLAEALDRDVLQGDGPARDLSLSDYLERADLTAGDRSLITVMVEGFEAAPVSDLSLESLRSEFSGGSSRQFRPARGYGVLVERLRRTLDLSARLDLDTPVAAIQWSERTGVQVTARDGRAFTARRVIVTVPVSLLRSAPGSPGRIIFDPPLTARQDAIERLGMGQAVRVVMRFRTPLWPDDLAFDFLHDPTAEFPTSWIQSNGTHHQMTSWAGGPKATALSSLGVDQLQSHALACAAAAVDVPLARARASLIDSHVHDFQHDPFAMGAYSYARPGGTDAAQALQQPLGGVLSFAGEATDTEYAGTVAGALGSGARAARQVLARL